MLILIINVALALTPFDVIVQQEKLECNQLEAAMKYADALDNRMVLEEDIDYLIQYLQSATSGAALVDVSRMNDIKERRKNVESMQVEDIQMLIDQIQAELDRENDELDLEYLEHLRHMIDECVCDNNIPENPHYKRIRQKSQLDSRIQMQHAQHVVKLPKRRRIPKGKQVDRRQPYDWEHEQEYEPPQFEEIII
ncbi:hypothetical protein pb186bvf_012249 [Paramecium bursaria]